MKKSKDVELRDGVAPDVKTMEGGELPEALQSGSETARKRGSLLGSFLNGAAFGAGKRGAEELLDSLLEFFE